MDRYMRQARRAWWAAGLAAGLTLAGLAAPSAACGCGAYVPSGGSAAVAGETSLVRFDGSTEEILMKLIVEGTSQEAAWVLPVPSTAEVSLGDPLVFHGLERLSAPRVEYRDDWTPDLSWLVPDEGDGAVGGAPPRGVEVRETTTIGPFEVARLAGTDSDAVGMWLEENGFSLSPGVRSGLDGYTSLGWEVVAVKLAADTSGQLGDGTLSPLQVSFRTDELVYPMRLSSGADQEQAVTLFVLSDHKMEPTTHPTGEQSSLRFAGRVDPSEGGDALAPYLAGTDYLTRWDDVFHEPRMIEQDYLFAAAADDGAFQEVTVVDRDRGAVTGLALLGLIVLGLGAAAWAVLASRRARPVRQQTPMAPGGATTAGP